MFGVIIGFFDALLTDMFKDSLKRKINGFLERRNVERTIERCSEAPSQTSS